MKICNDVIDVLANSSMSGCTLTLPGQLDRKLYMKVDKVLKAIKGKWNRKNQCHLFDVPPVEIVEQLLQTGEYVDQRKEFQFFETPENIANRMIELAEIREHETVLEPSAGRGAIAKYIKHCDCVELEESNREYLNDNGFSIVGKNFLDFNKEYDVIIANPPFTRQQDIDHVNHMFDLARKKIVAVMSSSVIWRTNKKTVEFRERVHALDSQIIELPEESFKSSGTNVNTCLVEINMPY